jgi:ribosomal protein L16/L10AE
VPEALAHEALALAQHKLPIKTKVVVRPDYVPAETHTRP